MSCGGADICSDTTARLIAAIQWREQQRRSHDAASRGGSVRATLAAPSAILRVSVGVPEVARSGCSRQV